MNTQKKLLTICIVLLSIMTSGCIEKIEKGKLTASDFIAENINTTLAFDLRKDESPIAGIVSRSTPSRNSTTIILPFNSESPTYDISMAGSTGHYQNMTVVAFTPPTSGVGAISFTPQLSPAPTGPYALSDLTGPLYLIRAGLQRSFIYKYPDDKNFICINQDWLRKLATNALDAIAVALPEGARGIEVANGYTSDPIHINQNQNARFYPASPTGKSLSLQIKYEIPQSADQAELGTAITELVKFAALLFATILFMNAKEISSHGWRLSALIAIPLIILGAVAALVNLQYTISKTLPMTFWLKTIGPIGIPFMYNALMSKIKKDTPTHETPNSE